MARHTYKAGEDGVHEPERLRLFNEAQHRILGQLNSLTSDRKERYPDDVFANIFTDWLEALRLAPRGMLMIIEGRHPHIR